MKTCNNNHIKFLFILILFTAPNYATATQFDIGELSAKALDEAAGLETEWQDPAVATKHPNLAEPLDADEQSVGFYANGRLHNPSKIKKSSNAWLKLFANRKTEFGNETMIQALTESAKTMQRIFPEGERMQIGDISSKKGGQLLRHLSHQNGLDADVVYFRNNYLEQDPQHVNGFTENFVAGSHITVNFDVKRNYFLLKNIVANYSVNRIFVDKAIKKALCRFSKLSKNYQEDQELLRRLRPLKNHKDHFHLRLKCPPNNPRCKSQAEPAVGTACG